jgi:hypothetical protein
MNREERAKILAESLRAAAKQAEQEQADKATVARITAAVRAKLTHVHASDEDLVCPSCGYKGPESDFEPDDDTDDTDRIRTDDETSKTGGDNDDVEELDAKGKSRVVAELLRNHRRRR